MKRSLLGLLFLALFLGQMSWAVELTAPKPMTTDTIDVRNIARAILSHQDTVAYSGNFGYEVTHLDGNVVSTQGTFEGRYFPKDGREIFMFTALSVSYDGKNPIIYTGDPFEVFPYPMKGTAKNLWIGINGFDQNGQPTRYGSFATSVWEKGQPIIFGMRPGYLPVIIPFSLNGRDPAGVGLIIDGWGGVPFGYSSDRGGFVAWLDPSTLYGGRVVDLFNGQATILTIPSFSYGDLPSSTEPRGSIANFQWESGVNSIKFEKGFYDPRGDGHYNTSIVEEGKLVPAAVYIVEPGDLQTSALYGALLDFAGRLQIEVFTAPGQRLVLLDKSWSSPSQVLNFEVPAGYHSVMITVTKSNGPVAIPEWYVWDPNRFYLMVGRSGQGGKG